MYQSIDAGIELTATAVYGCSRTVDFPTTFITENVQNLLGHAPDDFLRDSQFRTQLIHPADTERVLAALSRVGAARCQVEEYRLRRKDQRYVWFRDEMRAAGAGQIIGCLTEITQAGAQIPPDYRRQADELRVSLTEKEVLIKEIHHRVKNNLQVVCSILSLQASSTNEPWTLQMFREAEQRVMTIALIHEQLYTSDNLALLALGDYLRRVANHLRQCYRELESVTVTVECDSILLPLDIAQPCGLIVHELVSNSLKYAFLDGRPGEVAVKVTRDQNNQVLMTVTDTGVGLPHDLEIEKTDTLGLQLVGALARQLGGTLQISKKPAVIQISFACKGGAGHVKTANPNR